MSFLCFHEVSIEVPYERLLCLVIKSVKLGSLQFKPENVMVILDDVFFMSHARITGGMFGSSTGCFYDHPELELPIVAKVSLEEQLPINQIVVVGDHQYQLYQASPIHSSCPEVLSLLNQYPQIDGIEGRLSTDTSPTYFYKQEKSILIYYLMYRNGDLMRQIQFKIADPTPCKMEICCRDRKRQFFEGLYTGQVIDFKPFSLIGVQCDSVFICVTIPIGIHQKVWLSEMIMVILYGYLNNLNRKNEVLSFDLESYFTNP